MMVMLISQIGCGQDEQNDRVNTDARPPQVSDIKIVAPKEYAEVGKPVSLTGSFSANNGHPVYDWDFGDGIGKASGEQAQYVYSAAGIYTVALTVTGPVTGLHSGTHMNLVVTDLKADIVSVMPLNPAIGQKVAFTGLGQNGSSHYTYAWDFGDGHAGNEAQVDHSFSAAGEYAIRLTVHDEKFGLSSVIVRPLIVQPSQAGLKVQISGITPMSPVADQKIEFLGFAGDGSGNYRFHWDFGDGAKAVGMNPRHVYARPGTYAVTLTVHDQASMRQASGTTRLVVNTAPKVSALIPFVAPMEPMAKHEVDFGAMGSGFGVLTYRWNFGDGSEDSAGVVAKHVYSMPGDYVVTLRVTDELMHQESISRTISVQPAIQ